MCVYVICIKMIAVLKQHLRKLRANTFVLSCRFISLQTNIHALPNDYLYQYIYIYKYQNNIINVRIHAQSENCEYLQVCGRICNKFVKQARVTFTLSNICKDIVQVHTTFLFS